MKRKILSLLLSVSMLMSLIVTPVAAATSTYATVSATCTSDHTNPTVTVTASDFGFWETDGAAFNYLWSLDGYSSFATYIADKVATANATGSKTIVIEGCSNQASAKGAQDWVDAGHIKLKICTHPKTVAIGQGKEPVPCEEDGITPGLKCTICNAAIYPQQVIPFTHAKVVRTSGRIATCTSPGYTEGQKCETCGAIISMGGEMTPALGHSWGMDDVCRICGRNRAPGIEIPTYLITINNSDEASANIEGGYSWACGGTYVTIRPSATEGAKLTSLVVTATANGQIAGTERHENGTYTFIMPESPVTISVNGGQRYMVMVDNSTQNGTVSADMESATTGQIVTVTTAPNTGFETDKVTVSANGTTIPTSCTGENTYTFVMPNAVVSISAAFTQTQSANQVFIPTTEHGTVTTLDQRVMPGASVGVNITPDEGYKVASIKVTNASGNNVEYTGSDNYISFKMPDSDVTVEVTFTPAINKVALAQAEHCTVSISPTTAQAGSTVTVKMTPEEGYRYATFYVREILGSNNQVPVSYADDHLTLTFTMPETDVEVIAICEPLPPEHEVSVVENPNGTVEVEFADSRPDSEISFSVTPDLGYELDKVNVYETNAPAERVDVEGPAADGKYTFLMPEDAVTIDVTFKAILFSVRTTTSDNGSIRVRNGVTSAKIGDVITVDATPQGRYKGVELFASYMDGNNQPVVERVGIFTDNVCTFEMKPYNISLYATFEALPPEYAITVIKPTNGSVSVIPENGVSIAGETITVTATPAEGYMLQSISVTANEGNATVGTSNAVPFTFTMPESDVVITAEFKPIPVEHELFLTIPTMGGGKVEAVFENKLPGSEISVTATPEKGYEVASITVVESPSNTPIDIVQSEEAPNAFSFTMPDSDATVTVTFKASTHAITTGSGISVSPTSAVKGTAIVVTVEPEEGYKLSKLVVTPAEGEVEITPLEGLGNENKFMFIMPGCDVSVSAEYIASTPDYTVTIQKSINGSITASSTACKAGTLVTLTPQPAEGYALDSITIRAATSVKVEVEQKNGLYTFVMPSGDVEISATFQPATYRVHPTVRGNGTVRVDRTSAPMGATVTITATPDAGYTVGSVTIAKASTGEIIGSSQSGNNYSFTMPADAVTVVVSFTEVTKPTYTITPGTISNGAISITPRSAKEGAVIYVNTTPNNGYALDKLTIRTASGVVITPNMTSTGYHSFVMPTENVTVSATFKRTTNSVTVAGTNNGKLSASVESAESGQTVSIITVPSDGYVAKAVTVTTASGASVPVSNPAENLYTFTMPNSAVTISAEFAAIPRYEVNLGALSHGSATLSTNQAIAGATITITPKADTGYQVDTVTVRNSQTDSTINVTNHDGIYTFTMPTADVRVSVTFKEIVQPKPDYSVSITAPVNGYVQASSNMAKAGATVTVTAQPRTGYEIDVISVRANGNEVHTTTTADGCTFTMPEANVSITVTFKAAAQPITVNTSRNGSIELSAEAATPGSRVTITGTADSGYEFSGVTIVTVNGAVINAVKAANGQYSFTMPEQGVTVTGIFQPTQTPDVEYTITLAEIAHGVAKVSHTTATQGTQVTVTSNPASGYEFASMTITRADGSRVIATSLGNGAFSFTMPASNVDVAVTFKALTYNVKTTTSTNGAVRVDLARASAGDKVTITPVPNTGYKTDTVSVKTPEGRVINTTAASNGTYTFTMPADEVTVSATFTRTIIEPNTYTVNVASTTHGKVEATLVKAAEGTQVSIKATPDSGYEVESVNVSTKSGKAIGVSAQNGAYVFTMPAEEVLVRASFKQATTVSYSIEVVRSVNGVTELSATSAAEGTRIGITTKPDSGYATSSVQVKDYAGHTITVTKDSENHYSFTMPAGKVEVSATYTQGSTTSPTGYHVNIQSATNGVVTASPSQAPTGTQVTLNVTANSGYQLNTLTVRDSSNRPVIISKKFDGTFTFIMPDSDVLVTSTYTPTTTPTIPVMTRDITLNVSGLGKVESNNEHAAPGTTITITAKPDAGFYLGSMRVTTTAGLSVKLTKVDETTFEFILPTSNVTVYVSFWAINSNTDTPIMPGTNVDPNTPTNPSTPTIPSDPFPTLPNSPFDGVNAYQLPFRDMGMTSWFYQDVLYLYQRNVIRGVSANAFGPNQTTTRGEVATMLYRLAGEPAVSGASNFKDVAPLTYYTDAVTWAASKGYVTGYNTSTFGPGDKISREQLVTILYRYVVANSAGVDISNTNAFRSFGDASAVSGYAINAMTWACNAGIIKGDSTRMLKPGSSATRAEISAILHRFCEQYPFS